MLGLFLATSALATASPALATTNAPALGCIPRAGTVLSAKVLTRKVAWLPTSASSIWVAGPGQIQQTLTQTSTVGAAISASFALKESLIFASAEETYGITLSKTASHTQAWAYSFTVRNGITARVQVYHRGYELGIRQVVVTSSAQHPCGTKTETSLTGNFFPMRSNANINFCSAATVIRKTPIQVAAKCHKHL